MAVIGRAAVEATGRSAAASSAFGLRAGTDAGALTVRQKVVGMVSVAVVVAAIGALAAVSTPSSASRPELFAGSLALDNTRGQPVVIDLATGALTTRFTALAEYVDPDLRRARTYPVRDGTLLVSERGMINFLGLDNYLVRKDAGVLLARNLTDARAVAAGPSAYVVAQRADDMIHVALVDRSTVESNRTKGAVELDGTVEPRDAAYVSAAGDLWFVRDGKRVVQLGPPDPGERVLKNADRAAVGPRAVLAAGGPSTPTGDPTKVVIAEPERLRVLDPLGGTPTVEASSGINGARRIVPTTGSRSTVWFLYEDARGWLVVGIDTATGARGGPERISGMSFTAAPVAPAVSGDRLYTLDGHPTGSDGQTPALVEIDPRTGVATPVPGTDGQRVDYDLKDATERVDFAATQVIGRGPRVVFNNPHAVYAYVVFTDGSEPPALVDKTDTRNEFDPTQSPSELVKPPRQPDDPSTPTTAPPDELDEPDAPITPAAPPPAVNDTLDCENEGQKPHVPVFLPAAPLPRAVTLSWSYRMLDTRDCVPSSYLVSVRPLNGARSVGNPARQVDGQTQITFDGLRPNSTYEFTVRARIGNEETSSQPYQVTTLPVGPDKPRSVSVTADPARGAWRVAWSACGDACDVPVAAWAVEAVELCGTGNIAALPRVAVNGSATSAEVPYVGSYGDLVGRSIRFHVYGRAPDGINGDAASSQCVEGWRIPALDKLSFSASLTGAHDDGQIGARLELHVDGNPLSALGSKDVQLIYAVDGATVATHGLPTNGRQEVAVTASARREHRATLTVGSHGRTWVLPPQPFEDNVPWAAIGMTATADTTENPNVGMVTATARSLYDKAPGSTVVASGTLVCGSRAAPPFTDRPVGRDGTFTVEGIDLVNLGAQCELSATFREPAEPAFHAGPSPTVTTSVNLGRPRPRHTVGTFSAHWLADTGPLVVDGTPSRFGGDLTISYATRGDRSMPCSALVTVAPGASVSQPIQPDCFAAQTAGRQGNVRVRGVVTVTRQYLGEQLFMEFGAPDTVIKGDIPETTTTTTDASTTTSTIEPPPVESGTAAPPSPAVAALAVATRLTARSTRSRHRNHR